MHKLLSISASAKIENFLIYKNDKNKLRKANNKRKRHIHSSSNPAFYIKIFKNYQIVALNIIDRFLKGYVSKSNRQKHIMFVLIK